MKPGYISVRSIRKNLFKISDACQILGTTPRSLRWYEKLGLLPTTKRTRGRIRLYTQQEIDLVKKIKLLQNSGLKLTEIKSTLVKSGELKTATKNLKIFIDSTFSVPIEQALSADLEIIPMNVQFGIYTYKDFFTLAPETFAGLEQKKRLLAKTSAPTSAEYIKIFEQALSAGYQQIVSLHPDARIVSSFASAQTAAKQLGSVPIEIVDTRLLGAGFYFIQQELQAQKPTTISAVKKIINTLNKHITELILIGSLERFLDPGLDEWTKNILTSCPVLQHSALSGWTPLYRANDLAAAARFIKKNITKGKTFVLGYSSDKLKKTGEKLFAEIKLAEKIQYSSVLMSNLGRDILGLAIKN